MIPRALAVAACALLVAASPILAAVVRLGGGSLAVFTVTPELPIVTALIEITPGTLVRRDEGSRVTALVEAPDGTFDVRRIVTESIRLCLDGPLCDSGAAGRTPRVGDADHDGIRDLQVAFSRADVLALVAGLPAPADITFVVSAVLQDGIALSGTDTVRVVEHGASPEGDETGGDETDGDDPAEGGPDDALEPPGSPEDASPSPTTSPDGSAAEPEPSIVPAPTPAESGPPSSEPSPPGEQPTPRPSGEPAPPPSGEPTPMPSGEPVPTPTPTPVPGPELTPEPTASPQPMPTPSPGRTPDPDVEPTPGPSPGDAAPTA